MHGNGEKSIKWKGLQRMHIQLLADAFGKAYGSKKQRSSGSLESE